MPPLNLNIDNNHYNIINNNDNDILLSNNKDNIIIPNININSNNNINNSNNDILDINKLPKNIIQPKYNPKNLKEGILHIGTGNFALAHLASYIHDILNIDSNWGIIATSIRSEKTIKALNDQNNLYLLVNKKNNEKTIHCMAPIVKTIFGPIQPMKIFNEISNPNIKLITLTITNKGYFLSSGGKLDKKSSDIRHDLTNPNHPKTIYGYLAKGLINRMNNIENPNLQPISIVSLDNIEENSSTFKKSFIQYMELYEKLNNNFTIIKWINKNVDFLVTLVDRITPEPTDEFRQEIHNEININSSLTIGCENFRQLVIEKGRFETPCWENAGVTVVDSCSSYWQRKFYCLNAGHMIVAACGNRLGIPTIHQSMENKSVYNLLKLAQSEWCTIIKGDKNELIDYTQTIRDRFSDPSLNDTVRRVGGRATSKVSDRLLSAVEKSFKTNGKLLKVPAFATALYLLNIGLINEKSQKFIQDDAELHKMVSIYEFIIRRLKTLPSERNTLSPAAIQEILEDMSLALGGDPRFIKLSKNRQFVMCLAWSLVSIHRNGLEKAIDMLETYEPSNNTNTNSMTTANTLNINNMLRSSSNNGLNLSTLSLQINNEDIESKRLSTVSMI